ncbi:MAG TPA: flagellar assembly protein FliW [Candidatus Hydrogenedentes bacterium]|nr:flagellar assembly protein FliW [Candidatus Hydrogenedentota bacterium]HIJ72976.1 flagellar assembly protein FliW [Candidatus Hydrogenedentota bacterium]
MPLETTRFGAIDVKPEDVITFTQPILGFQEYRRFVLLPGPESSTVSWLQSTESGELAFILMDPRLVAPDYQIELSQHELAELAVTKISELDVYTLVVVPQDHTQIRTNLRAPILISPKHRLGKQTILEQTDYPIQFYLAPAQRGEGQPQEVSDACVDA